MMSTPRTTPSELIPLKEARERLGIAENTLYQALANGQIPGGRRMGGIKGDDGEWRGGTWRIVRSVFERWLVDGIEPSDTSTVRARAVRNRVVDLNSRRKVK